MFTNGDKTSVINILNERKIKMARVFDFVNEKDITSLTSIELMKLRRQHIRDRRMRKGSIICGQILSEPSDNSIIELYPEKDDMVI